MYYFRDLCETRPDVDFYLAPTTPRNKPFWFTGAQPAISRLIQLQLKEIQPRLLPLPGFQTDPTSLDTDGVHFSALAGIAYCQHIVDSARLATPNDLHFKPVHLRQAPPGLSPLLFYFISYQFTSGRPNRRGVFCKVIVCLTFGVKNFIHIQVCLATAVLGISHTTISYLFLSSPGPSQLQRGPKPPNSLCTSLKLSMS
jgi:hypothetical protein